MKRLLTVAGWIVAAVVFAASATACREAYQAGYDEGEIDGFEDGQRQAAGA